MYNKNIRKKRKTSPPPVVIPFTHPEYVTQLENTTIEEEDEFSEETQDSDYLNPTIYNVEPVASGSHAPPQRIDDTGAASAIYPDTPSPPPEEVTQVSPTSPPKTAYRTSVTQRRPIGWAFIRASLVGLSLIAFLAVVFAILSTKYSWARSEPYKYESNKDVDKRGEVMRSGDGDTSDGDVVCPFSPPAVNDCLTWNWDEESKDGGAVVLYECQTRRGIDVVLIVVCDCGTSQWKVVRNSTELCDCRLFDDVDNEVDTSYLDTENESIDVEKISPKVKLTTTEEDQTSFVGLG